jgi:hypothetical protein
MDPGDNQLSSELEAMAAIGRVLSGLPDEAARQRVLHWACERFGVDAAAIASLLPEGVFAEAVNIADDPALKLDSLDDMFEMAAPDGDDLTIPAAAVTVSEPAPATADASRQPVEAVLKSFVAEFQRFAEEWSGATA